MNSKYRWLQLFLMGAPAGVHEITLSFPQLEVITRKALAKAAYRDKNWWSNNPDDVDNPHTDTWIAIGWRVDAVHFLAAAGSSIRFKK